MERSILGKILLLFRYWTNHGRSRPLNLKLNWFRLSRLQFFINNNLICILGRTCYIELQHTSKCNHVVIHFTKFLPYSVPLWRHSALLGGTTSSQCEGYNLQIFILPTLVPHLEIMGGPCRHYNIMLSFLSIGL